MKNVPNLPLCALPRTLKEEIFKCNMDELTIKKYMACKDTPFWFDVLVSWHTFRMTQQSDITPDAQSLWWNQKILLDGNPMYYKHAHSKGLFFVSQLYIDQQLICVRQAKCMYGLSFIKFYGLVTAIPPSWRNSLQTGNFNNQTVYDKLLLHQKLANFVYVQAISTPPTYEKKVQWWEMELETSVSSQMFLKQFTSLYCITNIPKLRGFYYRLLHRALTMNTQNAQVGAETRQFMHILQRVFGINPPFVRSV